MNKDTKLFIHSNGNRRWSGAHREGGPYAEYIDGYKIFIHIDNIVHDVYGHIHTQKGYRCEYR